MLSHLNRNYRVENIWANEEINHFLMQQCFQRLSDAVISKLARKWERVIVYGHNKETTLLEIGYKLLI